MRPICLFAFVLVASSSAYQYRFDDWGNPIKVVGTNFGQGGIERIVSLYAQIFPRHLTNNDRVNFPRSGETERLFQAARAPGKIFIQFVQVIINCVEKKKKKIKQKHHS